MKLRQLSKQKYVSVSVLLTNTDLVKKYFRRSGYNVFDHLWLHLFPFQDVPRFFCLNNVNVFCKVFNSIGTKQIALP